MKYFKKDPWPSYLVGLLIAALSVGALYFIHHTLGTSTTFVRLAAAFWAVFSPEHLQENDYYKSYLENNSWINWQFALVVGIYFGALIGGIGNRRNPENVPGIWKERYGSGKALRYFGAFMGGIIALFGARLAGGCTSGHAISGGIQLAATGWIFMMGVFAIGIPAAFILYGKRS